jgi:sodium-coupled neutral amino acid transporter 11
MTGMDDSPELSTVDLPAEGPPPQQLRHQVSNIDPPKHKTGIAGTSSNVINSIVGSGIIGLPFAIKESGIVVGLSLLILVAYFTDKSLRMIVELATYHPDLKGRGVLTFEDLMSIPFGINGSRFILISMLILAYGAMVSYLIIIKDTVPTVLGFDNSFLEREVVMIIIGSVTVLPLSMLRDISLLAVTSSLSVLADVILVIVIVVHAPIKESVSDAGGFGQVVADNWINDRIFIGLGVLSLAMCCQHSAFLISGSLENHTSQRWAQVTKISLIAAGGLSSIFALTGYLGYLDETQGDILNNFDPDSKAANAGRALLAFTMVFTYPMESFVARHVMVQLVFDGNMDNNTVGPNGEVSPELKWMGLVGRRERWTLYIFLAALLPAMIFDDIGPVLSITGSLGASCLSYMAPGLVYLGLNGESFLAWTGQTLQDRGTKQAKESDHGQVELPVVGDATAVIQTAPEATYPHGQKPWWWFLTLMPIWVAIASSGARSTRAFIADFPANDYPHDTGETIGPRKRDFIFSMVFIVFGVIAAVFGVITNVYVHVHDIFFTSH